jgi:hypothetical protein
MATSMPFIFAPKRENSSISQRQKPPVPPSREKDTHRLEDSSWCTCGKCTMMLTADQCLCCREVEPVRAKLTDSIKCITETDDFTHVCLRREVLRSVAVLLHDQQGSRLPEPVPNKVYRLCAYRLFTSWVHGRLGAHNRRVVPACAVSQIRQTFPEDNAVYTGFLESVSTWPWWRGTKVDAPTALFRAIFTCRWKPTCNADVFNENIYENS